MDKHEQKKRIKEAITIYDLLPHDTDRKAKLISCPVPGHEDRNPSFSIFANGKLAKCQSQCGQFDTIGLYQKIHGVGFNDALKALAEIAGIPFPDNGNGQKRKIQATYDYQDKNGNLLFQVVRFTPKAFSQRRPDGKGGWIWNLNGIEPVPYNLPNVLKSETVFLLEGEKDCENLKELGLTASTSPMGAGKWRREYNPHFKNKSVVILADNDLPGAKHAEGIARSLKGIAKSVKVLSLSGLPGKGDVSDWIEARKKEGKTPDVIKAELLKLAEDTPEWELIEKPEDSAIRAVSISEFLQISFPPR